MSGAWRLFLLALAWACDTLAAIPLLWIGTVFARWSDALEQRANQGDRR